jgi:hypothetical protein
MDDQDRHRDPSCQFISGYIELCDGTRKKGLLVWTKMERPLARHLAWTSENLKVRRWRSDKHHPGLKSQSFFTELSRMLLHLP